MENSPLYKLLQDTPRSSDNNKNGIEDCQVIQDKSSESTKSTISAIVINKNKHSGKETLEKTIPMQKATKKMGGLFDIACHGTFLLNFSLVLIYICIHISTNALNYAYII